MYTCQYLINNFAVFISSFDIQELNIIVLSLTLLMIIRYTRATFGLLKETKFQSDLSISPLIIVTFNESNKKFSIKNIGKGVAINIIIETLDLFITDVNKKYSLKFDELNLLESNNIRDLSYKEYINDEENGAGIVYTYIRPDLNIKKDIEFTIEYQNCLGHEYYTIITIGKSGVKIIKIEKKNNIYWMFHQANKYFKNKGIKYYVYLQRFINKQKKEQKKSE